ncbi:MAG: hypothetical protein AB3N11_11335, partial [Arenibacterium sp.]
MALPLGVISVFAALIVWSALAVYGVVRRKFLPAILFGVALMLALNIGYVINGPVASIANFIGIYDVLINLGLSDASAAAAVMTCPDNSCTVWGDTFVAHPAWGVAFYDRFANGSDMRSALLMGHVVCNSIVFVLMHVQFFYPGGRSRNHALLGRISFAILTVGVGSATILASQHGSVEEYGGPLAAWGFFSMSAFVYLCAVMGILAIRNCGADWHRGWLLRVLGWPCASFRTVRLCVFYFEPLFCCVGYT